MTSFRPKDPLLLVGKALTIFMQAAMAIGAVALIMGMVALTIFRDRINAGLQQEFGQATASFPLLSALGVMLIGLAILGCIFVFFDRLRKIIRTVGEGDPFAPVNADRLGLMAWLLLTVHVLMLPAAAAAIELVRWADTIEESHVTIDGGLDLSGILMVIVLFILARVFRQGAAMREDLEGTV